MPSILAAEIMAAVLLIYLSWSMCIAWAYRDRSVSAALSVSVLPFLLIGACGAVLTIIVSDGSTKYGPAGEAVGWTHRSEMITTPVMTIDKKVPVVVTGSGDMVEVDPNANLSVGTILKYSCPPLDGAAGQYRTTPDCKQDTVRVACAKVCMPDSGWTWWALPETFINFGILLIPMAFNIVYGWRKEKKY